MATKPRNHATNDTPLTSRMEKEEKVLVETIRKIVE